MTLPGTVIWGIIGGVVLLLLLLVLYVFKFLASRSPERSFAYDLGGKLASVKHKQKRSTGGDLTRLVNLSRTRDYIETVVSDFARGSTDPVGVKRAFKRGYENEKMYKEFAL